jgi:precorrin-6B methylase 2
MPKCKIQGETIENLGSRRELGAADMRRIDEGIVREVDGFTTDIGAVCKECTPIYDRALLETDTTYPLATPKERRREVKRLIKNPEFVRSIIQEQTRAEIEQVMVDLELEFPLTKPFLVNLRALFRPFITKIAPPLTSAPPQQGVLDSKKASACLLDDERSSAFIEALIVKLRKLEATRNSIEVIDAGCGPIPIFGLIAAMKSPKANVTCLEANPESAAIAEEIIEQLGLEDRIKVVYTDATTYKHNRKIDLLISETMYAGLVNEPQVQIMRNLVPQVKAKGEIIPEEITVEAGLIKPFYVAGHPMVKPNTTGEIQILDDHFVISPETVTKFTRDQLAQSISIELNTSDLERRGEYYMTIGSTLGLGENLQGKPLSLENVASTITAPHVIPHPIEIQPGITKKVTLEYEPGTNGRTLEPKAS